MTDNDYTPPGVALGRRGLGSNIVGFRLYGDESGAREIMDAVVNRTIDIAVVWGPLAGYYAKRSQARLTIAPVSPARDGIVPFTFSIAAAVRKGDRALEQKIDAALRRNRAEVNAILASYGVPTIRRDGDR
jgi:mxaJ protein